ncbi:MAG: fumarate hydratase [bacterium]
MAITYQAVKTLSAQLYQWSLTKIPDDAKAALLAAERAETDPGARQTLATMRRSAERAESSGRLVCSDSGIPVFLVRIGTGARMEGDIKRAFADGFAELAKNAFPPILMHVTNPLTLERSHQGKDVPIITWEVVDGGDYLDITCSPKALGGGRWAALEIFSFPSLDAIEKYVMECVLKAGSQPCPPVVVGVGIGGTFDHCAKIAKLATMRPIGEPNPEPILAAMEGRLKHAVNRTGFGPMGTGGDSTALAVHVEYAAGHGFTPVAVCFNCWINRRTRARIYNDGHTERLE